ncbi:MAG: hypothetical protein V4805_07045 [Pseudomonadota bacterium]
MKNIISLVICIGSSVFGSLALSAEAPDTKTPMKCEVGPITKNFGGNQWLVYSCSDNRSLVIVSTDKSPVSPFYFMFFPKDGKYQLTGEGTGNKTATDAAYKQLNQLPEKDIVAMIRDTKEKAK